MILSIITILCSLCGCYEKKDVIIQGNKNNIVETKDEIRSETKNNSVNSKDTKEAEEVNLGDVIDIEPLKVTLEKFEVVPFYLFEGEVYMPSLGYPVTMKNSISPSTGMQLVALRGKLTNKVSNEVYTNNNFLKGEMIVNGNTYNTRLKCLNLDTAEDFSAVVAQQEVDYVLYAYVPENVATNIESCIINFGCVEGLDSSKLVMNLKDLDYLYTLNVDVESNIL